MSFIDDPTRIFRAIRFEQRFNFRLDKDSERFMKDAIHKGFIRSLANQRVRDELYKIFKERNPVPAIIRMNRLGVLSTLDEDIAITRSQIYKLNKFATFTMRYEKDDISDFISKPDKNILYLYIMFKSLSAEQSAILLKELRVSKKSIKSFVRLSTAARDISVKLSRLRTASKIYRLLETEPEAVLLYIYIFNEKTRGKIIRFLESRRRIKSLVSTADIRKLGLPMGPITGNLIKKLKLLQIDGKITDKKEAMQWIKRNASNRY